MDFSYSPEEIGFRDEVKGWLKKEIPARWFELNTGFWQETDESWQISRDFQRKLGSRGWLAPAYPRKYGGAELGHIKRLILAEELALHDAPVGIEHDITVNWVGLAIQHFGDDKQQTDYLRRIAAGDIIFCLGYSEPNSGSDLGSMQTRAVDQGTEFVVNGQKTWCSYAHHAEYCWLAAITEPDAAKHKNMSILVVDMKTPGIKVVPIINVLGCHSFNEVYFDDVRVPAENLVGQKGNGWLQLVIALDFERSSVNSAAICKMLLNKIIEYARSHKRNGHLISEDPIIRNKIAELAIEIEVVRTLCYRIAWIYSTGGHSNYESSMVMVLASELLRRISEFGMRVLGPYGLLMPGSKWAIEKADIARSCLSSISIGVGGGTNEIQKNIIAIRGLGLPRA